MKDPVETYLDAASAMLNLPIHQDHRPEVLLAFKVLIQHAASVTEFSLAENVESAQRFTP